MLRRNPSNELLMVSSPPTECDAISLYTDDLATHQEIKLEVKRLAAAFADVDNDYLIVLVDRLIANKFTRQRVADAVNHVLDNFPYRRPSISDIISYDRKLKLYTYAEMCAKCTPQFTADNFRIVEVNGRKMWVEK